MTKTGHVIFRIDPKDRRLIDRAAKIDRRSTSDFIRLAAIDKANEVIETDKQAKGPKKGT